jgi:hypothetical protein
MIPALATATVLSPSEIRDKKSDLNTKLVEERRKIRSVINRTNNLVI